jgi:site-specific recombinase XerD
MPDAQNERNPRRSAPAAPPSALADAEPDWDAALRRLNGAYAQATVRAYRADIALYVAWCAERTATPPFPAAPSAIRAYLQVGLSDHAPASVRRKLSALRIVHRLLGAADPTHNHTVTLALRRRGGHDRRTARQALGLTQSLRDRLLAACPATLRGLRDRALIAVGYDLLARRSELVALEVEDLQPLPTGGARILIRRSKTDPQGLGRYGYVTPAAYAQLQAWLDAADLTTGPIFRRVRSPQDARPRPLQPTAVNRILKAAARRAGLADVAARLSGHSLRVGAAQDLVLRGKTLPQLMLAGRWSTAEAVAHYSEAADLNIWA